MSAAIGSLAKLGIDTANPVTKRFDFQSDTLAMNEEVINANGVRGTTSHSVERIRAGLRRIAGAIVFKPTSQELANLLPWITGGTVTGTTTKTYPLADALAEYYVTSDRVMKVYTYAGCKPDVTIIRGRRGEAIEMELQLVGRTETVANAGTFPAITIDTTTYPFVFADLSVSVGGTAGILAREVTITVNRFIDKDRFFAGSNDLTSAETVNREIMVEMVVSYGDHATIYGTGLATSGLAVVCTFTNGSAVWTMTFAAVIFPRETPPVEGRTEEFLTIRGQAFQVGSTLEMVTTLAVGP